MGERWQEGQMRNHFYRRAKREGYRSRSAYKLKQLSKRYGLLKSGDVVVDLGAAPGGWLQVARELVGKDGFVLGIDLQKIENINFKNVVTIQGDITKPEIASIAREKLPESADVVLSDASPKITGVWEVDHARSADLGEAALDLARHLLKPGGITLIKVFSGGLFEDLVEKVRNAFDFVKVSKPKASRKRSAEVYIIGKGFLESPTTS